jgi:hypothetical protein
LCYLDHSRSESLENSGMKLHMKYKGEIKGNKR